MLCYCDRCGIITDTFRPEECRCYCCDKFPLLPIPKEYTDNFRWRDRDGEEAFIIEVIETSPNLDKDLYRIKDEIIEAKNDKLKAHTEAGKAILEGRDKGNKFGISCPYCHATNVRKVTATSKAVNTALFGIFGTKRHKQWHCDKCGSDF